DRAQIVRIFNAVEQEHKGVGSALVGEHLLDVAILLLCGDGNHALMVGGLGQTGELVARHGAQGNAIRTAELSDLLYACIAPAGNHGNVIKTASTDGERLFHRMYAKDDHEDLQPASARLATASVAAIGAAHKYDRRFADG